MKLFKNRGDIYFSKANKEKSTEQKILIIALIVIIVFTVIFISVLSVVNDFSAKKFFEPEELVTAALTDEMTQDTPDLPEVSGKNNFAVMVYEKNTLLFTALVQSDMDNKAYKASVLKGSTELDGNSLSGVFADSGAQNVMNSIEANLGIDIDYYISVESKEFEEFFNKLGSINYPILNDIKYRDNDSAATFTLKIKAGEQKIDGKHFINLIRYYVDGENNSSQANELLLAALSQQLNSENMEKADSLFRQFSSIAETNITIRDFSLAGDRLKVITNNQVNMSVYNAQAQFDGNQINDEDLKKIKGYFIK